MKNHRDKEEKKRKRRIRKLFLLSLVVLQYSAALATDIFMVDLKFRYSQNIFPEHYLYDHSFVVYGRICTILFFVGLLFVLVTKFYQHHAPDNRKAKTIWGGLPYATFCITICLASFIKHLILFIVNSIWLTTIFQWPSFFVIIINIVCLVLALKFIKDLYHRYMRAISQEERIFLLVCMTLATVFYCFMCHQCDLYFLVLNKVNYFYKRGMHPCLKHVIHSPYKYRDAIWRICEYIWYRPIFPYTARDAGYYKRHTPKAYLVWFYNEFKKYMSWPYREYVKSKNKKQ